MKRIFLVKCCILPIWSPSTAFIPQLMPLSVLLVALPTYSNTEVDTKGKGQQQLYADDCSSRMSNDSYESKIALSRYHQPNCSVNMVPDKNSTQNSIVLPGPCTIRALLHILTSKVVLNADRRSVALSRSTTIVVGTDFSGSNFYLHKTAIKPVEKWGEK